MRCEDTSRTVCKADRENFSIFRPVAQVRIPNSSNGLHGYGLRIIAMGGISLFEWTFFTMQERQVRSGRNSSSKSQLTVQ